MRLGVLLDRFLPARGGAEAHTDALLRRAVETEGFAALACLEGEPPEGVTRVDVGSAPRSRPARDRHLAVEGPRALRAAGCDVVLAVRHALSCDAYLPHGGLVGDAWAARDESRGGASLLDRIAARWSRKRAFLLECERALLDGPTGPRVVALSHAFAARLARVYPAARRRATVVPNGVDVERFDPAPFAAGRDATRREMDLEGRYVGLLLAHEPWLKGLSTVLAAMARPEVANLRPAFHLVVAGRRGGEDVRRAARRTGVLDRVRVAGPVEDPRPLYAAADVLAQPTWHDPCSLVSLEALAMGIPVVTTARNGVSELMGRRGGIVVEHPGSVEGVAVALGVLADERLRKDTGEDARWIARRTRLSTRLDQVLDVCRGGPSLARPAVREAEDEGPPADPSLVIS